MNAGMPMRIRLSALALGLLGIVSLAPVLAFVLFAGCSVEVVGPTVLSSDFCVVVLSDPLLFTPVVCAILIAGLLRPPSPRIGPVAVGSLLLGLLWVLPVLQSNPFNAPFDSLEQGVHATFALSVLAAVPFLLIVPAGRSAGPSRWAWIGSIAVSLGLWGLDQAFSGMMAPMPPPIQPGFPIVAGTVLAAGYVAGRLQSREGAASVS